MNPNTIHRSGSAAAIFSAYGPRPTLAPPDDLGAIAAQFETHHREVKGILEKSTADVGGAIARLDELEQKMARRGSFGQDETKSIGDQVIESEDFKSLAHRGAGKIRVKTVLTSGSTSAGPLAPSMRVREPDMMQRRAIRVRDLLAPGSTTSGSIEYPRQNLRTNAAAIQAAEGDAKPESALGFEMVTTNVRTIAHWIPQSVQVLQDAPMLASVIDSELRYGLADVEERQLLTGSGTGANLNGIYTQASAFAAPFTLPAPTMIDVVLLAIAQLEDLGYEPDGIIMRGTDWARILALKDTAGGYLGNGPFSETQIARLWSLPVAKTSAMTADKFMIGAFKRAAQIFDRQEATVEISTEHDDYFVRNLVAVRAEERLALAVYRTDAMVKGDFSDAITAATTV